VFFILKGVFVIATSVVFEEADEAIAATPLKGVTFLDFAPIGGVKLLLGVDSVSSNTPASKILVRTRNGVWWIAKLNEVRFGY
jgi:hypothetical protein